MAARRNEISTRVFKYGDVDTRGASGQDRLAILDAEERAALSQAKSNGEGAMRNALTRYQDARLRYKRRKDRRDEKNKANLPRIEFAEAWRSLSVQERYPHQHLNIIASGLIFILLAGLDFYVFAQAYAFVDDVADFSIQWWIGGLLGLVVFIAGVVFAHQIKTAIVSQAQRKLVRELREDDGQFSPTYRSRGKDRTLPFSHANVLALGLSGVIFGILVVLAIMVRMDGNTGDLATVFMTGTVPLVIVAIEIYLHDPLHRQVEKPNGLELRAERKARRRQIELENIIASYDGYVSKIQTGYAHQRQIASVTAADLGMELMDSNERVAPATPNEWKIEIASLLASRVDRDLLDGNLEENDLQRVETDSSQPSSAVS